MSSEPDASTTVGVTGAPWRASVSTWGAVSPWNVDANGAGPTLDWFIAADDRWHNPAQEPAVRQLRLAGTPVTETRVRIPDGDAVQRVWSVADGGGHTIIEVENGSPLPFAVAFCGIDVLTERPPTSVVVQGIDLPADAITLPVGHHASVRVALAHQGRQRSGVRPLASLPGADAVSRGWSAITSRASRLDLPDTALVDAVTTARCDLMLEGPVSPADDPLGFVLDAAELVRCGEDAAAWLLEVVRPIETASKMQDPILSAALAAAERIAITAGDESAASDIQRIRQRTAPANQPPSPGTFSDLSREGSVGRFVYAVEQCLADGRDLLPAGIPTRWLGTNFEIHGVPTSASSTVSYAVRWHGERPAVLWEQSGPVQQLTASALDAQWATSERSGETLWVAPRRPAESASLSVTSQPETSQPETSQPETSQPRSVTTLGVQTSQDPGSFT